MDPEYQHSVRVTSEADDLVRSRLTVFFRLLLALPHILWIIGWLILVLVVVILNWFATLFTGTPPAAFNRFITAFIRYSVHLTAYISLTSNPFPGFVGQPGSYPVDAQLPESPETQNRWKTGFRVILGIPAFFVDATLSGGGGGRGYSYSGGLLWTNAFLAWWVCLFTGRMPAGLRDLNLYAIRYAAQTHGYAFLVTDQYPDADPFVPPTPREAPAHPVRLNADDELERSRLTVFFRLLLAIPHLIWLYLWGIVVFFAAIGAWFAALFTRSVPDGLHRFIARYVRYYTHVGAYVLLAANPFPGFVGEQGSYPVDPEIAGPREQNRWKTGFRIILVIPALLVSGGLSGTLFVAALLGWFASLFTARMPRNLRQAQLLALRYNAQTYAYSLLLTDRYPFASPAPPAREDTAPTPPVAVPEPAA
jgi:Domain of unknown function (DUF4389)